MFQMLLSDKEWSTATRRAVLNCGGPQDDLNLPSDEYWYCGKIYNLGDGIQYTTDPQFSPRQYMTIWFKNASGQPQRILVNTNFTTGLLKMAERQHYIIPKPLFGIKHLECKFVAYELGSGESPEVLPSKGTRKESI
jgi:hypothetical protein